jgi:hypothetical protein
MYFDDLQLLRTIDAHERSGLTGSLINGIELLRELVGIGQVLDEPVYRDFVRELELAKSSGYLDYDLMQWTAPGRGGIDQVEATTTSSTSVIFAFYFQVEIGRGAGLSNTTLQTPPMTTAVRLLG